MKIPTSTRTTELSSVAGTGFTDKGIGSYAGQGQRALYCILYTSEL